jgi:hypothetical protein
LVKQIASPSCARLAMIVMTPPKLFSIHFKP